MSQLMLKQLSLERQKNTPSYLFGIPLIFILILVLTAGAFGDSIDSVLGPPPGSYKILAEDSIIRIPFELYRGDIRFECEVNGYQVHLLQDDGFLWDQLLLWGGDVDSLGLEYDGEVNIGGGADHDDGIACKTASGITVSFPDIEFYEQTAIVTPSSSGVSTMWSGSAGQVSTMFLKHFVVDINFDNMMITLIPKENFIYQGNGTAVPWQPLGFGPRGIPATLRLADGREVSLTLLMDLGYNEQLQLRTAGEHNITLPDRVVPAGLGMNIQKHETCGFIGRLPAVIIGGYEINNPLVAYVPEEHHENTISEAMVGLGLLSRFNLTFDFYRQRIFFEPTHKFNDSFEYDMSGMTTRKGPGDYLNIVQILPDSPADKAGLKEGDRIIKINGKNATLFDYWELQPVLQQEGKTIELDVLQNDQEKKMTLTLRRLL